MRHKYINKIKKSMDNKAVIVTKLQGLVPCWGQRSVCHSVQTGSRFYSVSYPMGMGVLTTRVKWPKRESDFSPSYNVVVKSAWSCISIPHTP
jgi:hypothetical protein